MRYAISLLFLTLALASSGCRTVDARTVDIATGEKLLTSELAARLDDVDVVFLGELHDSDEAHELQLELTEALLERRGDVIVSLEMFERDIQAHVDLYLAGEMDEAAFLASSRPWPNYAEDYRPVIELAREHGLTVVAANIPRPLAAEVAREGLDQVRYQWWMPRDVETPPGAYRDNFVDAMGGHGAELDMDRFFAAQAVKDEAMAESIELAMVLAGPEPPIVVHWNGRFHSDYGLGTVERLLRRRPELRVAIVTTVREGTAEPGVADYVWYVD